MWLICINASDAALDLMNQGQFDRVILKIEKGDGPNRWFFYTREENYCSSALIRLVRSFCNSLLLLSRLSNTAIEWKDGRDVQTYFEEAKHFHEKLHRSVKKASSLGKNILRIREEGMEGCIVGSSYWSEIISPLHLAKGVSLELMRTFNIRPSHQKGLDFEAWLKSEGGLACLEGCVGHRDVQQAQVARLNDEERKQHLVEFREQEDGVFLFYHGKPLRTSEFQSEDTVGRAIFVIGPDKQIYIGNHRVGNFHHSSIFGGQAVIAAGEIITDEKGKLIAITDKSGHYKPSIKAVIDGLSIFRSKMKARLSDVTLILVPKKRFRENGQYYSGRYNAEEYLQQNGKSARTELLISDYA